MIEAVNSVIANASLLRGIAEQGGTSRAVLTASSSPESRPAVPLAPYISPHIEVDTDFDTAVLQIRDSDTGDVLRQFPSESTLEARKRAESAAELQQAVQTSRSARSTSAESSSTGLYSVSEIASNASATGLSIPSVDLNVSAGTNVAQAQIASSALSAGAQTANTGSSSVSVTA